MIKALFDIGYPQDHSAMSRIRIEYGNYRIVFDKHFQVSDRFEVVDLEQGWVGSRVAKQIGDRCT